MRSRWSSMIAWPWWGSANFDILSISMNSELSVVIEDAKIVEQLRVQHEKGLELSEEVTLG